MGGLIIQCFSVIEASKVFRNLINFFYNVCNNFIKPPKSKFILLMMTSTLFWWSRGQKLRHLSKYFMTPSRLLILKYFPMIEHELNKLDFLHKFPRSMIFLFVDPLFFEFKFDLLFLAQGKTVLKTGGIVSFNIKLILWEIILKYFKLRH